MTVLQVCAYGAEYPGNFIASLEALEAALKRKGINTIYAFVGRAADKDWCRQIQKRTKVYFLPEAKARILPKTYQVFQKIYKENDIGIAHSHFELYDIPATVMAPRGTRVYWHLHDPIEKQKGLRGILWKLQYGIVGKRATLISVSDQYRQTVIAMGFPAEQTTTVLNGIDLERIRDCRSKASRDISFLTFGWDFQRKGDDLILKACDRLEQEGYRFRLLLNGNEKTWPHLEAYLAGREPAYLVKGDPVSDVNSLFEHAKVFVQASRRETFSYAVCEAAYAGLPVICSDIAGLEWAHDVPSVSFFENENWEGLYRSMKDFLDGCEVKKQAIDQSRETIAVHHSVNAWADQMIRQYQV